MRTKLAGLRGRKGNLHEGEMRVPFIVRWPGHTPVGATNDEIVAFPDMLPTMCDLLGVTTPKCDSVSLRALFEGKPLAAPHPPFMYDFFEYGGQQAVIDGKWKLIRKEIRNAGPAHVPAWEFYDLAAPVNHWDEAVPLGNGTVGVLLWGETNLVRLSLDRGDLWDEHPSPAFLKVRDRFNWATMHQLRQHQPASRRGNGI